MILKILKMELFLVFLSGNICAILFSPILYVSADDEDSPPSPRVNLNINLGEIVGTVETSRGGRKFYQFRGIQYGVIPKRFMESEPVSKKWDGVKDATDYGAKCLQAGTGEEDCLFLNVYTPFIEKSKPKLAVLFFIHGGAFIIGSGDMYGAEYWMDEDVVVVTINYRLSVLGFLNLGIDDAPGNQGLKDQLLALKWVQQNIANFNGDKDRVTIFGESAGGASVSYQIVTPLSKGLFHGAISQSGTAICPWALSPKPMEQSLILARLTGCANPNKEEILKCLIAKDTTELFEHMRYDIVPKDLGEDTTDILTALSFVPGVETRAPSSKSTIFLPKLPMEIMKAQEFQSVPWIIGANDIEGYLFQKDIKLKSLKTEEEIKAEWQKLAPQAFNYRDRPPKEQLAISMSIGKFYFDGRTDVMENVTNLCSDRMFFFCSKVAAEFHSQKSPVYLYYFEEKGGFSVMSFFMGAGKPPGPTHADELAFQWKFFSPVIESADADIMPGNPLYNFSKDFTSMWAHFAQTGKPKDMWNSKPIKWDPISKEAPQNPKWLHLNTDANMLEEPQNFQQRMKFWRESPLKL